MPNKVIDLTGKRFGRLVVIEKLESDKHKSPKWLCKCDCGELKVVTGPHLRNGATRSCGCLRRETVAERSVEIARQVGHRNKKHGMHRTRIYNIWQGAKDRCTNHNSKCYPRYGGRGITICDEWRNSFDAFWSWAKDNGYNDDLTLDRKDNDGPYSPDNCRWVTMKEQANNRRGNRLVTYNEQTKTAAQWAAEYGLSRDAFLRRLAAGWAIEKALTEPSQRTNEKTKELGL